MSAPLFNRALSRTIPPGSTYKPLGALIALEEGQSHLPADMIVMVLMVVTYVVKNVRRNGRAMLQIYVLLLHGPVTHSSLM